MTLVPLTYKSVTGQFIEANWRIGALKFVPDYEQNKLVLSSPVGGGGAFNFGGPPGLTIGTTTMIGHFDDSFAPGLTATDYTVTIDWGDGTQTSGTLVADESIEGSYFVYADSSHTYNNPGPYSLSITITDDLDDPPIQLLPGTVTVYGGGGAGHP